MGARRAGRHGAWSRRRPRQGSRCVTRSRFAPTDIDGVNAPAFAGTSVIASHTPAEPAACGNEWQVDHGRNEALRIAAPRLTTCNRTAPIGADRAVVTANNEAAARDKNILKGISTIKTNLQDATVESQIGIHVRCFEIEVVSKGQLR